MNLLEQIRSIAETYPERIALAEAEREFTYRELIQAVSLIKKQVEQQKLSSGPIIVFGKNDFITLSSMLAVNVTGHAYIPVDAHTPFERTELIFKAAQPAGVLTTSTLTEDYERLFEGRININLEEIVFDEKFPELSLAQSVSGTDSNYIIYTSGTTGIPKGVEVSHDNLLSFTRWMNQDFEIIEHNHILSQALYSFDLSIFSLYPSLTTGGTLVSLSRDETTNFKLLFNRLNRSNINTWISTPSFVEICLLDPSFIQDNHPDLKQFIFCGEELTVKTAGKLLKAFPDSKLFNTYGPTEATGAISAIEITSKHLEENKRLPIGYAKPGVELKIVDGEIIIIGDSVAKGYYKNPDKTSASFFTFEGKAAYHTGDAGSINPDGLLQYQGRIDFQVKFNGFRIELQDIESHLLSIDEVEHAIVLPEFNNEHKVTALIAFVQTQRIFSSKAEERAFTKELKKDLSKTLMDYMMPTRFVYRTSFPLTANGKVDRKALELKERGE